LVVRARSGRGTGPSGGCARLVADAAEVEPPERDPFPPADCPREAMLGDTDRAMSRTNVELVREGYTRWRTGDYDLLLDFFLTNAAADIELYSRFGGLSGAPYRGHDGLRAWLTEIQENFVHFEPWLDEAREAGDDRVVAVGGISFRARESGVDMADRLGWVYEFRNRQLRRMMFFGSPDEALEAVGLAE
jgi:ketosteroid isomerase-like protein